MRRTYSNKWLKRAIHALPLKWAGGKPAGTVNLPPHDWVRLDETAELPPRVGLRKSEPHVRTNWGVLVNETFPESNPIVRVSKGYNNPVNYNGNFGTWIENIRFLCKGRADGVQFGGAQMSGVRNCRIEFPWDTCLYLGTGTSRTRLDDLDFYGHPSASARWGRGLRLLSCNGTTGTNIHAHRLMVGIACYSSHSTTINGYTAEKTTVTFRAREGASTIHVHGCDWQRTGDTPIDLTGAGSDILIKGAIRKSPATTYWVDQRGERHILSTTSDRNTPQPFKIEA